MPGSAVICSCFQKFSSLRNPVQVLEDAKTALVIRGTKTASLQ